VAKERNVDLNKKIGVKDEDMEKLRVTVKRLVTFDHSRLCGKFVSFQPRLVKYHVPLVS
jgi:hypothetical protein